MPVQNSLLFIRVVTVLHRGVWRLTGGRIGPKLGRYDSLLLVTTGRKSGKKRVAPLLYFSSGDDLLVVASNGGNDETPGWYLNVVANPRAEIELGREKRSVTAQVAGPEEKARLWPGITAVYANYDSYQERTKREIPVVVLKRASP